MTLRKALIDAGVPVVDTRFVTTEADAIASSRELGMPVAVKADAPGLLHKSDIGSVRLNCATDEQGRASLSCSHRQCAEAGFACSGVLIQPMASGIAEAYAGVINDPIFGPAVVFGLGGIFVEVLKDTVTEMAPLTHADARRMIASIKAAPLLYGARGRRHADVEALASLLVGLGNFAVVNAGRFAALDINPIIVKAVGACAVDIALDITRASGRAAFAPMTI